MEENSRIERAKQFCAFDALKGLREELKKKEEEIENIYKKTTQKENNMIQ